MPLIHYFCVFLQSPGRPWPDRQWGLCIWDDLLEHLGPVSTYLYRFLADLVYFGILGSFLDSFTF